MAIDFCIGNTIKEAARPETYASLIDEIQDSLKEKEIPRKSFIELILDLNPYGDKVYSKKQINFIHQLFAIAT
ncbi:hypothetical protein [Priestia megaterium]|uniref:hypothetical protein n=1 Tax=Priestia megaterium TaxID=1404 RepID=UPI00366B96DE